MNRGLCRKVLEQHYKVPFNKAMVLGFRIDFYNKDLMVGLMFNSFHHYKYSSKFHKTYKKFKETQTRDILRRKMCSEVGIELISIPYSVSYIVGVMRMSLGVLYSCNCTECGVLRGLFKRKTQNGKHIDTMSTN